MNRTAAGILGAITGAGAMLILLTIIGVRQRERFVTDTTLLTEPDMTIPSQTVTPGQVWMPSSWKPHTHTCHVPLMLHNCVCDCGAVYNQDTPNGWDRP